MTEYFTFIILLNAYSSIVFAPDLVLFISFDRITEYSSIIMLLLNEHYCGKVQRSAATKTAAAETRASRLPGGRVVLCQEIDHARFVCISFSLLSLYNDMMSVLS